ncbi:MAG: protein-export chaperone SecB [Alphaproteobacteria bacterium]
MADNDKENPEDGGAPKSANGNGSDAPGFSGNQVPRVTGAPAPADPTSPHMSVVAQYVKDLSFENPEAPKSLTPRQAQPKIDVNINVSAKRVSDTDLEISLKLEAKANDTTDKIVLFAVELDYGGLFRVLNIPDKQLGAIAMVECPRLLFPFARQILADATRGGGFPPLMLEPVDFVALYRERLRREAEGTGPALDISTPPTTN